MTADQEATIREMLEAFYGPVVGGAQYTRLPDAVRMAAAYAIAERAVLERAAKVADHEFGQWDVPTPMEYRAGAMKASTNIAELIRSLATPPSSAPTNDPVEET